MIDNTDEPIFGEIVSTSVPIKHASSGMNFHFNGRSLYVFTESMDFLAMMEMTAEEAKAEPIEVDAIIEGRVKPSGERIAFHASCTPGYRDGQISFGIIDYWVLSASRDLEDVNMLRITGECIDSFCPVTTVSVNSDGESHSISVSSYDANEIELGELQLEDLPVAISANAFWAYEFARKIELGSYIDCEIDYATHPLLKSIYIGLSSALRFCLGRGNVSLNVSLCVKRPSGWERVGRFVAVHGKMYIPDEYDGGEVSFIRAKDVGNYFADIVGAYSSGALCGPELNQSREDAGYYDDAKVIRLTSSFEREFKKLYPDGVTHGAATKRAYEQAKAALIDACEELPSKPKRIVKRMLDHVEDNSLEASIRHACKELPENVRDITFRNTGANLSNNNLGKKIANMRNDIAHGNNPNRDLSTVREEYKLLSRLLLVMRLTRLGVPEEDVARLIGCMG